MTTNKGGRPPSVHGPLNDSYTFRTNDERKAAFLAIAGPAEINQFMAWFNGEEVDGQQVELPERPCDARNAA